MTQPAHCPYCQAPPEYRVEVHGHVQCQRCKINIQPCCDGAAMDDNGGKIMSDDAERYLVGKCEGCRAEVREGDLAHHSDDAVMCETCSPSYADMLATPRHFGNPDERPITAEEARSIVEAHTAAGGAVSDKIVWRM